MTDTNFTEVSPETAFRLPHALVRDKKFLYDFSAFGATLPTVNVTTHFMEVLLLTDIPGVGKKNDLIVVKNGYALNHLLPMRKALVVTPNVRKRYAEQIKQRALEREHERQILTSASAALSGKTVHFTAKTTKTGKLYAAISEEKIIAALKQEHAIELTADAVQIPTPIKSVGTHTVTLSVGSQTLPLTVEVKAEN